MSWRTIVIENPSKLTLLSEYLVVTGENIRRIHLSEIDTIIIENRQVTITVPLINELVSNNINVLICDSFHNPFSQIISIYGNYQQSLIKCIKTIKVE